MEVDPVEEDIWNGSIPHQPNGTEIFYYVLGEANDGKVQVRPLAAPAGYYNFTVEGVTSSVNEPLSTTMDAIYPNPASAIIETISAVVTKLSLLLLFNCSSVELFI